jgi:CO dehydrogenase maturation factor
MRIAFVGKGGSGKTTLASAFIRYMAEHRPILAIDADVNVHLRSTLGFAHTRDVGHSYSEIANYVAGQRTDLGNTTMVATTPPSLQSRFIRFNENDEFITTYTSKKGNIRLLSIGTYRDSDVGHTCYHGKLNTLELIYHHLLDHDEDIVVADATAGIDNLGTSLFFAYDVNIFVVEPTRKSIEVFLEFEKVSKGYGIHTMVVANKIENGDLEFIEQYIGRERLLGVIPHSHAIRRFEQGDEEALEEFVEQNRACLARIAEYTSTRTRDWDAYYTLLLETHKKNSIEWWNDYYQQPIDRQCDPEFSYKKVL